MAKIQSKVMEDRVREIRDDRIQFYQESETPEDEDFVSIETEPYEDQPRIDIVTDGDETNLYLCWEFIFSTCSEHIAGTYATCYDLAFELAEIIYKNFNVECQINIESSFIYQSEYENPVEQTT